MSAPAARDFEAIQRESGRILESVRRRHCRVLRGDLFRKINDDLCLFPGGVVLHLSVEHHDAGAVGHGFEDAECEFHFAGFGREDALGDVDLAGVERARGGELLSEAGGSVKLALLMALGGLDAHRAATHLATAGPSLREALAALPPS